MASTTTQIVTYEEWLLMPIVEEAREEVVNGEIRIMPANHEPHANAVDNLADLLRDKLDRRIIKVRTTSFAIVIRRKPLTTREPDIALFIKRNMVVADGYVHSAPELVVEVLSPGNRPGDFQQKLRDYESLGVPEVWVVSNENKTVEVLQLEEGRFRSIGILSEGMIAPKLFPQALIEVAAIWEK